MVEQTIVTKLGVLRWTDPQALNNVYIQNNCDNLSVTDTTLAKNDKTFYLKNDNKYGTAHTILN